MRYHAMMFSRTFTCLEWVESVEFWEAGVPVPFTILAFVFSPQKMGHRSSAQMVIDPGQPRFFLGQPSGVDGPYRTGPKKDSSLASKKWLNAMVYGRYNYSSWRLYWFINQHSHNWGAPSCTPRFPWWIECWFWSPSGRPSARQSFLMERWSRWRTMFTARRGGDWSRLKPWKPWNMGTFCFKNAPKPHPNHLPSGDD